MLDASLVATVAVVAAGNVGVSGCDMAMDRGSSGGRTGGW